MARKSETPYLETETLLALMNEDHLRVDRLLAEFSYSELNTFARQLDRLLVIIRSERRKREDAHAREDGA